jgi:hypothetical protein
VLLIFCTYLRKSTDVSSSISHFPFIICVFITRLHTPEMVIAASLLRQLLALLSAILIGVAATDEAGTKYLEVKSKLADVVTLPSGLRYKIVRKGNGSFHPKASAPCLCHYAGTLIDGTEFDSSYSRGEPTTFAPNQVIKG